MTFIIIIGVLCALLLAPPSVAAVIATAGAIFIALMLTRSK